MKSTSLRRILVPIDFSPESLKTLRLAKLLATRFRAKLHLVHVVSPPVIVPPRRMMVPFAYSEKGVAASALKRLKKLVAELSLPARSSPCTVRSGAPVDEIKQAARDINADLIAIGTRGYTGLKHAFLGSTTERVIREAPCPVLVVRDGEHQGGRSARTTLQFRKILVPVDFSACSRVGLEYALGFAPEFGAGLVLFHSVAVHSYALGDEYTAREAPIVLGLQQDFAEDEMRSLRDGLPESKLEIETRITVGSPVEQIADYVRAHEVDLIITSTHGRSGLQRMFIGSTAERIVRHASCSVLVVPNRLPEQMQTKAAPDF